MGVGRIPITLANMDKHGKQSQEQRAETHPTGPASSASGQPGAARMSLGAELRAVRIERGVSLERISEDTHISLRLLQSLEENQYESLPGGMYNRAIMRTYCEYLGLQPAAYLERMERETASQIDRPTKPSSPSPHLPAQGLKVPPIVIWSLMLLVSVTGLFFSRGWIASVFSPYFAHAPSSPLPGGAGAPESDTAKPTEPPARTQASPAPMPATISASAQAMLEKRPPAAIRLRFQVDQECWISVTADGARLVSRILRPGENVTYDAEDRIFLILGNAGGVSLQINGQPSRPLGKPGEVIRVLINKQTIPDLLIKAVPHAP